MFRVCVACIFLTTLCVCGHAALAQSQSDDHSQAELSASQQALYAQMLDNPANLDVAFEYAAVSTRLGDFEAAITALERMLLFAPDLPRVQLELGVLYYRLESYGTARHYLTQAVSGDDVPPEVRERVEVYLREIDQRQSPHQWSGALFGGVRYQTNANAAPESRDLIIGGLPFQLRDQDTEQEDFNVFISASLRYAYDLGRQGDKLVADIAAYGSRYRDQDIVDTEILQVTVGPLFDFAKYGYEGGSVRPYALANGARLGREPYFTTLGGGVSAVLPAGRNDVTSIRAEYQKRDYRDTTPRPTASNRDGWRASLDTGIQHSFSPRTAAGLKLGAAREDAREKFESRWEYGAGLNLTTHVNVSGSPWRVSMDIAYRIVRHDEPDIAISTESQRDNEFLAQLGLAIPLTRKTAIVLQGGYRRVNSNYDIAEYDNSFGLMGIAAKF